VTMNPNCTSDQIKKTKAFVMERIPIMIFNKGWVIHPSRIRVTEVGGDNLMIQHTPSGRHIIIEPYVVRHLAETWQTIYFPKRFSQTCAFIVRDFERNVYEDIKPRPVTDLANEEAEDRDWKNKIDRTGRMSFIVPGDVK
jgi:hypothetical protein